MTKKMLYLWFCQIHFFFIFISVRKWCGMRFFFHTYPKHMYLLLLSVFDSITTEEKQQYSLNHSPLFNLVLNYIMKNEKVAHYISLSIQYDFNFKWFRYSCYTMIYIINVWFLCRFLKSDSLHHSNKKYE